MKVSYNWIQEFIDFPLPPVDELVVKIGAQLGAVEETIDLSKKYQGIVIVKVVECAKIEDSDHLNVCKIDDGGVVQDIERDEQGLVQVVCGASNVRAGIMVAWLPPGSTVPSSFDDAEPFVLGARPLRGFISNGMLASPKELAIGDSHEGILEIDGDYVAGQDFAKAFELNDYIIDIENKMFTHRPDCFGQLGIAREMAGILGHKFTTDPLFSASKTGKTGDDNLLLEIRNEIPELVPRFTAQIFNNVTIKPSPVWLQTKLSRVGIRPINNVVDVTNYFMILTGQPLHAYDYDKVMAQDPGADHATIVIRQPHDQEKMTLLNSKEITIRSEAIVIASNTQPIGLGGVMGGENTEVDTQTTNIILECATFDMYSIRKTSMHHGLFSDAVTRFNKGQSPLQNLQILAAAGDQILQTAEATSANTVYDLNSLSQSVQERNSLYPPIQITSEYINERLGLDFDNQIVKTILENVEFLVTVTDDILHITAPFWRTDIELREDIVEEVGRLHGFDKLPLELPKRDIMPTQKDATLQLKAQIRTVLSKAGANEVLTYSFVHGDLLSKVGQDKDLAFKLSNALSPDLQYYRLSLTPSLLEKIHPNIKAGYDQFALFELGKAHMQDHADDPESQPAGVPTEFDRIALVFAANNKAEQRYGGAAFYEARKYLETLLKELGIFGQISFMMYEPDTYIGSTKTKTSQYEVGRTASILIDNFCLGEIGEYKASVRKALKLPDYAAGFELDLGLLLRYYDRQRNYKPLPRFPKVTQDVTLKVASRITYQQVFDSALSALQSVLPEQTLPTLNLIDIYQRDDDEAHKQVTLRLTVASYEKTLTDAEVSKLLDAIAESVQQELQGERI